MSDTAWIYRDRVRERDLDNFLIEELQASEDFRTWFLSKLPESFRPSLELEVKLQKSPQRLQDVRQTDVRIGWFDQAETLCACVLIESKVTADFQPGQAESYFNEVQAQQKSLGSANACSVLIAPREKFKSLPGAKLFHSMIAIEEMAEFLTHRRISKVLAPELDARLAMRTSLLWALAGKRVTESWVPVTVESKRNFAVA